MLAIVFLSSVSIWQWARMLTWNDALSALVTLGAVASIIVPYVDASWFRGFLVGFIAVSLKLQNLANAQEIKKSQTRVIDAQTTSLTHQG